MKVYLAMTLLTVLILSSCKAELRDLCYDHNHWNNVDIRFDWQHAPEADAKGMSVLFYNQLEPGREAERYEFIGHQGGQARLLPGTWQALAYNNDTEAILYRGSESINTLEAYTRESSIEEGTQLTSAGMPRATGTEDEPVILEPDPLWGVASEPIVTNTEKKDVSMTLLPTARAHRMTITIHNVPNLQYTNGIGGSLTGLAPGVNMLTGEPLEGCATEAFVGSVIDETTLQMHLMIFGHCPHESAGSIHAHKLVIYAILADNSKWYYTVDVSNQMHSKSPDPGPGPDPTVDDDEVNIELEQLPIPKPITNGSGFQPGVDGWQNIEINVDM